MERKLFFYLTSFFAFSCLLLVTIGLASSYKHDMDPQRVLLGTPPTSDTLINTVYAGSQNEAAVTKLKSGKTVITWQGGGSQDGSDYGIFARMFNVDGTPIGSAEFVVNTYTAGTQGMPAIAALKDGGFVIAWHSNVQDGNGYGIFAQRYNADGTRNGVEFQVNTYTSSDQQYPYVAASASDGGFLIVWYSLFQDGSVTGSYGQRYNADGTKNGAEFRANTYTSNDQNYPVATFLSDGGFIVAWTSNQDPSGGGNGIYAQRYNADGTTNGAEFRVNTYTTSDQSYAAIALLLDGRYVISWQSSGQDGSGTGVYAQMFNADGTTNGAEFRVNTYTSSGQQYAVIAALADGGFIIAWQSAGQDGSGAGVFAQVYNVNGATAGSEFQVNTDTNIDQSKPTVTGLTNGFLIVWHSIAMIAPETDTGVYAKWFVCPDATPYVYNNNCYDPCPAAAPYLYNGGCLVTCPSVAPNLYNSECFATCPSAAPVAQDGECTEASPEGTGTGTETGTETEIELEEPKEATVVNNENKATNIAMKALSVVSSSTPNYVFASNSDSMILYIRYLKVNYPEKVLEMFAARGKDMVSAGLGIGVPSKVEKSLTRRLLLLDIYEYYDVTSSFLYHLWDPILSFLILIVATVLIISLEYITRKCDKIHLVFKILLYIAKWNLPLIVICGNFNNILFYSILEFKSVDLETAMKNVSFAACVITLIVVALTLLMTLLIARNVMQSRTNPKLKKNWNDFAILYQPFKDNSYLTLSFFPIYFLRLLVFNIILTTEFSSAVPQTIIIAGLSLLMVIYLIWKRPLKSKILLTQILFNEIILLILNIAVVILAVFDHQEREAVDERDALGELIIIMNMLFSTSNLVFIGVIVLLILIVLYKKVKTAKAQGYTSCGQIIEFILTPQPDQPKSVSPSPIFKKEAHVTSIDISHSRFAQSPTDQSPLFPKTSSKFDSSGLDLSISKSPGMKRGKNTRQVHPSQVSVSRKSLLGGSDLVIQDMKERSLKIERLNRKTSADAKTEVDGLSPVRNQVESPEPKLPSFKQQIGALYGTRARRMRNPSEF